MLVTGVIRLYTYDILCSFIRGIRQLIAVKNSTLPTTKLKSLYNSVFIRVRHEEN
jgi:hypothetical protein